MVPLDVSVVMDNLPSSRFSTIDVSEDEEPRRAEKEQMSAPQEEFIQEKPQPSKGKEK